MKTPKSTDVDPKLVATLLSDPEYFEESQKTLSGFLGISEVVFSKYKAEAIRTGLLKPVPPRLNIRNSSEKQRLQAEIRQRIGKSDLESQLVALSGNTLQRVLVFGNSKQTMKDNYTALAEGAARYLTELILKDSTRYTGVAWGETISNVVYEIVNLQKGRQQSEARNKHFIPVCGDSRIALSDTSQRGSKLIKLLYEAFTGSEENNYSHSVAASIPGSFKQRELKIIRRFLMHVGDFGNVFELDDEFNLRLRPVLDLLITSCGTNSQQSNNWLEECATREGISCSRLESMTVGNLGGYWLGRDGISVKDRKILDHINARWNGIRYQDFKKLLDRKATCLVAGSSDKAEIVIHLMKNKRLISHLLISADLASKIEEKISLLAK